MEVIYDCSSESYINLIELLSQCEWVDPEERQNITDLAPYMTVVERQQISDSLMIEAGQLLHSSEVEP